MMRGGKTALEERAKFEIEQDTEHAVGILLLLIGPTGCKKDVIAPEVTVEKELQNEDSTSSGHSNSPEVTIIKKLPKITTIGNHKESKLSGQRKIKREKPHVRELKYLASENEPGTTSSPEVTIIKKLPKITTIGNHKESKLSGQRKIKREKPHVRELKYLASENEPGTTSIYQDMKQHYQRGGAPQPEEPETPAPEPATD